MWLEPTTAISIVARAQDLTPVITAAPYGRLELGDVCDVISTVDAIVVLHCPSDSGGCTSYGAFYGCDAYFVTTCYDFEHSSCPSDGIGIGVTNSETWCCPENYPNCVTMIQSNGLKHFECYDWLEGQYDVLDPSEVDIFESSLLTEWARTEVTVTQTFASMQTVVVHSDDTPVGAIVGGTIGGVALLGFAAAVAVFFFMRSRKKHKNGAARSGEPATPEIAQLPASVPSSPIATVPSGLSHGGPSVLSYYSQSQHDNGPNKASPLLYAQGPIDHQQQQQIHEAPGN